MRNFIVVATHNPYADIGLRKFESTKIRVEAECHAHAEEIVQKGLNPLSTG